MCYVLLSFLSCGGTSHAWSWSPHNSTVTALAFYALICTRAAEQLARPGTRLGLSKMLPSCPKCPRFPSFLENGANILSIASMGVAISPPPNCPMVPFSRHGQDSQPTHISVSGPDACSVADGASTLHGIISGSFRYR